MITELELLKHIYAYYDIEYNICPLDGTIKEVISKPKSATIIWHKSIADALIHWLPEMIKTNTNVYAANNIMVVHNTWDEYQIRFIKALELRKELTAKYEFASDYEDFILYTNNFEIGAPIVVQYMNPDDYETPMQKGIISGLYKRSDDIEFYENADDCFAAYKKSYDVSGEFITDKDCYYVFITANSITDNKKANMKYWNIIEGICENCIRDYADVSITKIDPDKLEEHIYDLTSEVRDSILDALRKIGGVFPFIDENY